jgi:acyl-CoA synthetase (AMP-forming)/AMP-acid ligase II
MCSGHRIGTAEVESALVSHPKCAEAAVVGVEHEVLNVPVFLRELLKISFCSISKPWYLAVVRLKDRGFMPSLPLWKVNLTAKNFGKVLYSQCGSRSVFNRAA